MSLSPGHRPHTNLAGALGRRRQSDSPDHRTGAVPRGVARALAVAERQTLTGALERIADTRPGAAVPEVLYTDLGVAVPTVLRSLILSQLSMNGLVTATDTCISVVRLMALQPSRRWLDPLLVLRVALLVQESSGKDIALLSAARELIGARRRWAASVSRHGGAIDAGDPEDWHLVEELTNLPLSFPPMLRAIVARSIIRQDVLGARGSLTAYANRHRQAALEARRLLDHHAPTLSSLYGAELTPTRRVIAAPNQDTSNRSTTRIWTWMALGTLVIAVLASLLLARPAPARAEHSAVSVICNTVGQDHPSCLTASALTTGLDHGDCTLASQALPILETQLAGFGLNRELAVIRADTLGQLREPYNQLRASYLMHCP